MYACGAEYLFYLCVSAEVALELMRKGTHNRRVAETKANCKSSRSHMVFTVVVEKSVTSETGLEKKTYSRLNLVDLAGKKDTSCSFLLY